MTRARRSDPCAPTDVRAGGHSSTPAEKVAAFEKQSRTAREEARRLPYTSPNLTGRDHPRARPSGQRQPGPLAVPLLVPYVSCAAQLCCHADRGAEASGCQGAPSFRVLAPDADGAAPLACAGGCWSQHPEAAVSARSCLRPRCTAQPSLRLIMDEDMDATPPAAARGYGVSVEDLVDALRERLQSLHGGQLFDLPVPPALPEPATEAQLRERGQARERELVVARAGGDSFLRAAARELAFDEHAYRRVQRRAVVRALALCSPTSVDAALAAMGWLSLSRSDDWARDMVHDYMPFDGLALMIWSLLNATSVLVLGRVAADDRDFSAPIYEAEEPYEGLMLGHLDTADGCATVDPLLSTAFVGFAPFLHVFAEPASTTGRGLCILDIGHLSDAAKNVNTPLEALAWLNMPVWQKPKGGTAKEYCGDIFIIGDGFESTRMFRSSVKPLEHCLHTSRVSASYPGGPPLFTVEAADRPGLLLSGDSATAAWRLCFKRSKDAFTALPPEVRSSQKDMSDVNGKGKFLFGFTSVDFLTKQESLDPEKQFQLYWERKIMVTAQIPTSTNKRSASAAGNSSAGAGGSGISGEVAAPRRLATKRQRVLTQSLAAAGDGMQPLPEHSALVEAPHPATAAPLGADAPLIDDLAADDGAEFSSSPRVRQS